MLIQNMVATKRAARVDTSTWLTRNQAMDLLGVSMTSLYRWEREGRLHPGVGQREGSVRMVTIYNPEELARLPRKTRVPDSEGEITARVFELFEVGASVREIVLRERQTIAKIEALHEAWLDAGGAELVIGQTAKAEIERHVGPFKSVGELVQRIADELGMPITSTPIDEVIARGQEDRVALEVVAPVDASDKQIERAIIAALDASAP